MLTFFRTLAACLLLLAPLEASSAHEQGHKNVSLEFSQAWARTTGNRTLSAAVYLSLRNTGDMDLMIRGAETDIAKMARVHRSFEDKNGIVKMEHVEGISVPKGTNFTFVPGGYHIMLTKLKAPLKEGDVFNLILQFEKAEDVTIPVLVTGMAGLTP